MDIFGKDFAENYFNHVLIEWKNRKLFQLLIVSFVAPTKLSMMPLAPVSTELPAAHKPKIGFSIDSIVGGGCTNKVSSFKPIKSAKSNHLSSQLGACKDDKFRKGTSTITITESSFPQASDVTGDNNTTFGLKSGDVHAISNAFTHLQSHPQQIFSNSGSNAKSGNASPQNPISTSSHFHDVVSQGSNNSSTISSPKMASSFNIFTTVSNPSPSTNNSISSNKDIMSYQYHHLHNNGITNDSVTSLTPSPPPVITTNINVTSSSKSSSPHDSDCQKSQRNNSHVSTEVTRHAVSRALQPSVGFQPPVQPSSQHLPPVGAHGMPQFAAHPKGMMNFAAAVVAAQYQQHHHPGLPGWMPPGQHPPRHPATAHPLYPWLLAKHSRLFPHRFGPGSDLPGFLLQPFRKPKRIRTAFSPSQLLQLEHAFERNHYMVGAERKQLANSLSLSETQVKVWFQNRRTKHKRTRPDEETVRKPGSGSGSVNDSNLSSSAISADSSTRNYNSDEMMMMMSEEEEGDDTEKIIMDDDDLYHKQEI